MIKQDPALKYWLALARIPNFGIKHCQLLLKSFGNIESIFTAKTLDLENIGCSPHLIQNLMKPDWKGVKKDSQWLEKDNRCVINFLDDSYPPLLAEIPYPPLLLFAAGNIQTLKTPQLAIVGSRKPTLIGKEIAHQFANLLGQNGLTITSGLALGIDTAAHQGALSNGFPSIAVLGSGIDYIYPQKNAKLAEALINNGILVSEYSCSVLPHPHHFPHRNRIVSGLSLGVLVVEAAARSGSLITARLAAEQGREVFAIPGSIYNQMSKGCHQLIQNGAKLVESVEDILCELENLYHYTINNLRSCMSREPELEEKLPSEQKNILDCIAAEPTPLDMIIAHSKLPVQQLTVALSELELAGYITFLQGGYVKN